MQSKHEFAIYYSQVASIIQNHTVGNVIEVKDETVVGRIKNVLRLEPNEHIILFDDTSHASATITSIKKSSIELKINSISENKPLQPAIKMLLPILKRDAMEQSLAAMCELGVNIVQPIITAKSQHAFDQKDIDRACKIMRAAAEQSKQFAIPKLLPATSLEKALSETPASHRIFFDVAGEPIKTYLTKIDQTPKGAFACLVGPEGDLTLEEKQTVIDAGFSAVKLTPTILRSWQAAFLGVGIIRSYANLAS